MTCPPEPPRATKRAVVVGLGLIGGSIGLGLRRAGWHVTGSDRDAVRAERALELGVIDALGVDPGAQVTFIATPVGSIAAAARAALDAGPGTVTDVGGVKASVAAAVDDPRFIGGHPMAGSEREGVEGADPDLFTGAAWVLTPTATTDPDAFALVHATVSALGAEVVAVDPDRHDAIVAVVSHVPHLTAAALMRVAAGHASDQQGPLLRLAAGGFRDMTRISAGHPGIWPDICADNAEAITGVLDELVAELQRLRSIVWSRRRTDLVDTLEEARALRLALPARRAGRAADVVEVRVPVSNRPGSMVEVTVLASDLGINLESVETADATEYERGLIVMVVDRVAAIRFRDALLDKGYHPTVQAIG
jgi:prephenate dehydrogenase